ISSAILLILFCACNQQEAPDWKLIYQTDKEANTAFGDKEELIKLVRLGYPIRIGWESRGKTSVEHTIDARFLTIANETEVFAQLAPFWGQRPDLSSDTLSITHFASETNWILSTNGLRSSMMVDIQKDTTIIYPPSPFKYPIKWYAKIK
ncbi:MAG: hypothetical protein AAGD05_08645, partial [Bacteroidota bacterium]